MNLACFTELMNWASLIETGSSRFQYALHDKSKQREDGEREDGGRMGEDGGGEGTGKREKSTGVMSGQRGGERRRAYMQADIRSCSMFQLSSNEYVPKDWSDRFGWIHLFIYKK